MHISSFSLLETKKVCTKFVIANLTVIQNERIEKANEIHSFILYYQKSNFEGTRIANNKLFYICVSNYTSNRN